MGASVRGPEPRGPDGRSATLWVGCRPNLDNLIGVRAETTDAHRMSARDANLGYAWGVRKGRHRVSTVDPLALAPIK